MTFHEFEQLNPFEKAGYDPETAKQMTEIQERTGFSSELLLAFMSTLWAMKPPAFRIEPTRLPPQVFRESAKPHPCPAKRRKRKRR